MLFAHSKWGGYCWHNTDGSCYVKGTRHKRPLAWLRGSCPRIDKAAWTRRWVAAHSWGRSDRQELRYGVCFRGDVSGARAPGTGAHCACCATSYAWKRIMPRCTQMMSQSVFRNQSRTSNAASKDKKRPTATHSGDDSAGDTTINTGWNVSGLGDGSIRWFRERFPNQGHARLMLLFRKK